MTYLSDVLGPSNNQQTGVYDYQYISYVAYLSDVLGPSNNKQTGVYGYQDKITRLWSFVM